MPIQAVEGIGDRMDGSTETGQEAGDGALRLHPDPPSLRGWARSTLLSPEDAPEDAPEIGLDIDGLGTRVLTARADGAGGFVIDWPLPAELRDGVPREARAFHLVTGRELAGSPLRIEAAPPEDAPAPPEPAAAAGPLTLWPGGLAGVIPAALSELAEGLHGGAQPPAVTQRFEMVPGRMAAQPGVRLVLDAPSPRVTLLFRLDGVPAGPLLVTAWLPEATEPNMHAVLELSLQAREGHGFRRLRVLRRARAFRRPVEIPVDFHPTAEEAGAWLAVEALAAKGLAALMPRPAPAAPDSPRFEDPRLDATLARARGFARIHGAAPESEPESGPAPLPVSLPVPVPLRRPARAAGGAHPFTQVVVPVCNGGEEVRACLRQLCAAATGPMQVVVVDDGSRGLTAGLLREEAARDPRLVLHRRDVNRGYTKSINEGVMLAGADWVVVLNSDTLVPKGWLDRLHAAARARPGAGMVGPLSNAASWQSLPAVKRPDGSWSTNEAIRPEHLDRMQALLDGATERAYPDVPLLNGFCTLISREVFDRVGLYDEEAFPMGYGEETDLCLRARAAGFRLVVADDCFVFHHKSVSFGVARSGLTRAGGLEMANKHPGVVIPALERMMQESAVLGRLRGRLAGLAELLA